MSAPAARLSLVFLVVFAGLSLLHAFDRSHRLTIDLRAHTSGEAQLFHRAEAAVFTPDRQVTFSLVGDGAWHRYSVTLPRYRSTAALRFDPPHTTPVEIGAVTAVSGRGGRHVAAAGIAGSIELVNDATVQPGAVGTVVTPLGEDPFVELALPPEGSTLRLVLARVAASAALALLLLPLMTVEGRRRLSTLRGYVARCATSGARALSDGGVLIVPSSAMLVLGALALAAVAYVSLGLHQSSLGVWEQMYPSQPVEQAVELGEPKRIRSDEWNTQTPWVLNQVQRGWPERNSTVGGQEAPLLAAVPVAHPIAIGQPKFLGFALFDLDTGFSWWWAYKTFGLVAAFFWMLLVLTRGHTFASAAGAAMVYSSSFTQWWFSSNLAEILIAFAMAIVGGSYLLLAQRIRGMLAGALLSFFAIAGLVLHLYPPFIVPLAYLGIAIMVGLLIEPGRVAAVRVRWRFRATASMGLVLATALFLLCYSTSVNDTIGTMMATVYPGNRVASSGDMALDRLMYGWFEGFRFGEQRIPAGSGNASEASSYVVFAPALVLLFPLSMLARPRNALLLSVLAYTLLTGLWICVQLPQPVERAYQLAGWSWTPPARAVIGFGLASVVATFVGFSRASDDPSQLRRPVARRMLPLACVLGFFCFGLTLREQDPAFFSWPVLLAGALLAGLFASALAFQSRVALGMAVVLVAIPGLNVNPLSTGLSALSEKPVLSAAHRQGGGPGDRWAVVGDFVLSQGLKARGLDVVTGSHMVPNRAITAVLDPEARWVHVWNRYAHVIYASDPTRQTPEFVLNQSDLYTVTLAVCSRPLQRLGVTHVAYTVPVPAADLRCLEPLPSPPESGVRLFRLRKDEGARPVDLQ